VSGLDITAKSRLNRVVNPRPDHAARQAPDQDQDAAMLTIAQITDLHVTSDKDPVNKKRNAKRLRAVLASIHALQPRPLAIIASGDLVDRGEPEEYAELRAILRDVEIPIHMGLGNHDKRAPFRAAYPEVPLDERGFVQYAADIGGLRLIMLDTLDEASGDGAFCDDRAAWLTRTLDAAPGIPTIIALHHPPILSGIQWMDPKPDDPWVLRLARALKGREQVLTAVCGHTHRAFHGVLAGHVFAAAPATSIQLTLNLTPVDMRIPDGREILVDEPPGYALLMWEQGALTTHTCIAGHYAPAVTYETPFIKDGEAPMRA
jgi:3',5'-cyclic AMP phosphodiesterase CpdA